MVFVKIFSASSLFTVVEAFSSPLFLICLHCLFSLSFSLPLIFLAVRAGVVTVIVDLALLIGSFKSYVLHQLKSYWLESRTRRGCRLENSLISVVALPGDGVNVEVEGDDRLTAELGWVMCLRTELVGDVALLEELESVLDL